MGATIMAKAKTDYPPEFEEAWALYPRRPNNNKRKALKAWNARLQEGYTPADLVEGMKHYLAWAEEQGTEPRYLLHTSTLWGPDLRFLDFPDATRDSDERSTNEADPDEQDLLHFYEEEEVV
jgi:hypothetical protein